jgi:hypothetical protein
MRYETCYLSMEKGNTNRPTAGVQLGRLGPLKLDTRCSLPDNISDFYVAIIGKQDVKMDI